MSIKSPRSSPEPAAAALSQVDQIHPTRYLATARVGLLLGVLASVVRGQGITESLIPAASESATNQIGRVTAHDACQTVHGGGSEDTFVANLSAADNVVALSTSIGGEGSSGAAVPTVSDENVSSSLGIDRLVARVINPTNVVFAPDQGPSGTRVLVRGKGISRDSRVTFGDHPAAVFFIGKGRLVALVPLQMQGTPLAPLPAAILSLAVDGVPVGSFAVTALPENPNPPGAVLNSAVTQASAEFLSARPALEARLDTLLGTAMDPDLHILLAATKAALPTIQTTLQTSPDLEAIPSDLLRIIERQLLTMPQGSPEVAAGRSATTEGFQSTSATCATPMDQVLCDRVAFEHAIQATQDITRMCDVLALAFLVPAPVVAVGLGEVCLATDLALEIASVLKVPRVLSIRLDGLHSLASRQATTYQAVATTGCSVPLDTLATILLHVGLKISTHLPEELIHGLASWQSVLAKLASGRLPEFDCPAGFNNSGPVSPENLGWSTRPFQNLLSVINPGQVQVSDLAEDKTVTLNAQLVDALLMGEESKYFQYSCDNGISGCLAISLRAKLRLTLMEAGSGSGEILHPDGENCGVGCNAYPVGTPIVLTAVAVEPSVFDHWSGACSGALKECTVVMDQDETVTATFAGGAALLTVGTIGAGGGNGTVTSGDGRINCKIPSSSAAHCTATYAVGEQVTLTATPDSTPVLSQFTGWDGAGCSGTGPCVVTFTADVGIVAVTASFVAPTAVKRLTLIKAGTGAGGISHPPGESCGVDCVAYPAGTQITLTAVAIEPSVFTGWSGACSGTTTECTVVMDQDMAATATFDDVTGLVGIATLSCTVELDASNRNLPLLRIRANGDAQGPSGSYLIYGGLDIPPQWGWQDGTCCVRTETPEMTCASWAECRQGLGEPANSVWSVEVVVPSDSTIPAFAYQYSTLILRLTMHLASATPTLIAEDHKDVVCRR